MEVRHTLWLLLASDSTKCLQAHMVAESSITMPQPASKPAAVAAALSDRAACRPPASLPLRAAG